MTTRRPAPEAPPLELWGGHECTVNRVGDGWMDQTRLSGHHDRPGDLDLFADLGLKALRYPVLWERVSPDSPDKADWSWSDERLERLRALDIRPIVGLVHHGSGPHYTNLLDDGFAEGLARHARATAERYPWVKDWTPVNEPLTTARFSALYGLWYPHLRDEGAFWRALLNQIDAVRLSMKAIREVVPDARLVQTEDLGRCYGTELTAEQAAFENHRRFMTWDLLCGSVKPGHALWPRLVRFGLKKRLAAIAADPCPPDIVGVNHYVTSDRFIDHRVERYPPETRGGNGWIEYADVEAVRVLEQSPRGLALALEDAWERYHLPVAVTECHLGCTREEQLRWLGEAWATVRQAHADGMDVRALTAWSLLGAYDWDSLLTNARGRYECGVFDVRSGTPRPTAAAGLLKALSNRAATPLAASGEGWWRRDTRLLFEPSRPICGTALSRGSEGRSTEQARPILILGATGTLGQAFARGCAQRALSHVLTDRKGLDLADPVSIAAALEKNDPWAVVNAAGWVRVDDAEHHPEACMAANAWGAVALAEACRDRDIPLVSISSDLVFDGRTREPYLEDHETNPLNVYGRSKAEAERRLLAMGGRNLVLRTSAFFSPHDRHNFAVAVAQALEAGGVFTAARDQTVSPTYVPDLVNAALDLLIDGEIGLWHLANRGAVSWAEFARQVAGKLDLDPRQVRAVPTSTFKLPAARPRWSVLGSSRGVLLPSFEEALDRFAEGYRTGAPVVRTRSSDAA